MPAPAIQLVRGQNAPLSLTSAVLTVDVAAPADLSALLVTESGKVRTDADFVFYNQPVGPGVRCHQPAAGQPWRVEVDLAAVPADIHAVRIVVSLDDATGQFGRLPEPVARLSDPAGTPLVESRLAGLTTESVVVAMEVYRRGGAWKVRAVGQGYAGGLADLITDHGVSVDDAPPPPAPAAAAAPAPPAPAAPPRQPAPAHVPPPAPTHGQVPSAPMPSAPMPSAPMPGQAPQAPAYQPPPMAPAPTFGQASPPQQRASHQPAPHQPAPHQPAPQQAAPHPHQPTQPPPGGEVQLTKDRPVSLSKGQKVTLTKDGGVRLTTIRMGLGWDPLRKRGLFGSREADIDLDASALLFAGRQPVDIAFYNQLTSKDGSVVHTGDNRTGAGEGDDETLVVDLNRVPAQVTTIVFVVTSYEGQTFEQVAGAFCRLVDHTTGTELARYTLAGGTPFTGMTMAKVYREGGTWKLQAIGEGMAARTPTETVPHLARFLD